MHREWLGLLVFAAAGCLSACGSPETAAPPASAAPPALNASVAPPALNASVAPAGLNAPTGPGALDAPPPAGASACSSRSVTFGTVRKREVLTEVAAAVVITSSKGGPLDAPLRPVRRYTAQVVTGAEVPRQLVYDAFLRKIKGDDVFPELGTVAASGGDAVTLDGPGRVVAYEGVRAREATFRYRCGDVRVDGEVTSWMIAVSGVLDCADKPAARGTMAAEAAAVSCVD